MNSYIGISKEMLMFQLGQPNSITPTDNGEIITYSREVNIPARTSTWYDNQGGAHNHYHPAISYTENKNFNCYTAEGKTIVIGWSVTKIPH